ncbi:unnamed protein product [Schistocephalus solidus]|uniref:PPE-SVP domain-containing protein n=1 Tax=Schistocephalus solidus TaxID=70667 RepID=A0A183T8S3_SCHSO|nr:unnamed protein product [Schistocephalus solidus]
MKPMYTTLSPYIIQKATALSPPPPETDDKTDSRRPEMGEGAGGWRGGSRHGRSNTPASDPTEWERVGAAGAALGVPPHLARIPQSGSAAGMAGAALGVPPHLARIPQSGRP